MQVVFCAVLSVLADEAIQARNITALPAAEEVVFRAVAHARSTETARRRAEYGFTKRAVQQELDADGRPKVTTQKIFQIQGGQAQLQEIRVNGQVLPPAEMRKREAEYLEQRKQLTDGKPARRDENWENLLTPELASRYRYELLRQEQVNGRTAYVIGFKPLPNLPTKKVADRLLNVVQGTLWIDRDEFEIAKADLRLNSKVALPWVLELLGSVSKFQYTLERTRIEENLWFNHISTGNFEGRKLWDTSRVRTRAETTGFHKLAKSGQPLASADR